MKTIVVDSSPERDIIDFRTDGFRDVLVLGRYAYTAAHPALEPHTHGERMEICYLDGGRQEYVVENRRYELTGGDVFVTFPNERHGTGRRPESIGTLYWMILSCRPGRSRLLDLPRRQSAALLDRLLGLNPRHFRGKAALKRTFDRIFDVYGRSDEPLRMVDVRNLLLRSLLDVLICAQRYQHSGPGETIAAVQRLVREQPGRMFSLADLAVAADLSVSRFKARFKTEVGQPPGKWMMEQKIRAAADMLCTPGISVTETAVRLGFSSSQYFATVFRRHTGKTPSGFRGETSA